MLFTNTVPTNSESDSGQDLPDNVEESDNAEEQAVDDPGGNEADVGGAEAGPLQRAQDAIDQGQEAAREALKDDPDDQTSSG